MLALIFRVVCAIAAFWTGLVSLEVIYGSQLENEKVAVNIPKFVFVD